MFSLFSSNEPPPEDTLQQPHGSDHSTAQAASQEEKAKKPIKPLPILKSADKLLAQQLTHETQERGKAISQAIATEKLERTQSLSEMKQTLQKMESELRELRGQMSVQGVATNATLPLQSHQDTARIELSFRQQLDEHKAALQRQLDAQASALTPQLASAGGSGVDHAALRDLPARMKALEEVSNALVAKVDSARDESTAMTRQMSGRSKPWTASCTAPQIEAAYEQVDVVPMGNRRSVPLESNAQGLSTVSSFIKRVGMSTHRVNGKGLDEWQTQIEAHLQTVRTVLLELHVSIGVHAVKMAITALRTMEMPPKDRAMAKKQLEAKQEKLQADLVHVRTKTDQYSDTLLTDILNKDERMDSYLNGSPRKNSQLSGGPVVLDM